MSNGFKDYSVLIQLIPNTGTTKFLMDPFTDYLSYAI